MELSLFIAKLLGVYTLITGVAFLLNLKEYRKYVEDVIRDRMFLMLKMFIGILIGLTLTIKHNIWVTDWRVLITIFGWASLIGGTFGLLFPRTVVNMAKALLKQNVILAASVLWIIIGAYLAYVGFVAA
jgi:hypothetical protein